MFVPCPTCRTKVETEAQSARDAVCPACGSPLWLKPRLDASAIDIAFGALGEAPAPLLRPPQVPLAQSAAQGREQAFVHNSRGVALTNQGAHAKAIAEFTQAIRLDPKYAGAYNNRGYARAACRSYDQALA